MLMLLKGWEGDPGERVGHMHPWEYGRLTRGGNPR